MKRFVFLDIDGTLCDRDGKVPDTAKEAIDRARENGHKVFLCTGRSVSEIKPSIKEICFDGMVTGAGYYVECDGQAVFHKTLQKDSLRELVLFMEKENISYVLERNESCIITKKGIEILRQLFESEHIFSKEESEIFLNSLVLDENPLEIQDVNKILYFNSKYTVEELTQRFGTEFFILPSSIEAMGEKSGEISDKKINKATGIQKVLEFYKKDRECVIAVGDSLNDREMIQYAKVGIVMGNGHRELKEIADYITQSVQNNGIRDCFLRYNLI